MNFLYALLRSFLPLGRLLIKVVLITLLVAAVLFGTILKAAWAAGKSR
jgi:hypothetical protein